jgi:hypothetical protein
MEDLNWSTSSFSSANGQCVECARTPEGGMAVRDTKDREGAMLRFDATEWREFTERVRTTVLR